MKYVLIKPVGGLANRIRVMEAAYNFSQVHSAILTVIWEKNRNLNADYEDCFIKPAGVRIINLDYNGSSLASSLKRKFYDTCETIARVFFTTANRFDNNIENLLCSEEPDDKIKLHFDELAHTNKGIFIETCYEFYPNHLNYRIGIRTDIKLQAFHLLETRPGLIGIHIRHSERDRSVRFTPVMRFIEEICKHLADAPGANFYLSTDSEEIVHRLQEIFQEKIITGITVRRRDSKEGIIAALTDMCCLSKCKKILGSYQSSFSKRAAIIGNIPLQIVQV